MERPLAALTERRSGYDRRQRTMYFVDALRWGGRRAGFRRAADARIGYVDRPRPSVTAMTIFLVIASAFDAYFTLLHLQEGAWEANPFMGLALNLGMPAFVGAKMSLTLLGVVVLSVHQRFLLGWKGLQFLCIFYGVLLIYHGLLLDALH
jgi:hypothetical protein